tara:strand:+ start:111263 stop:111622 length:360 start_codon:yes stop_codon:yes gene_type:complete
MGRSNILGKQGEELALSFLQQRGLILLQKNYRSRFGEIDLVMEDKEHIVFVEVRLRSSEIFGGASGSVNHRKQSKLIKCAQHYIATQPTRLGFRFDVIAISPSARQHEIQWITNAFDEF